MEKPINHIRHLGIKIGGRYSSKIIFINVISLILTALSFLPLIPVVLNYPPYIFENQNVYVKIYGVSYTEVYMIMVFAAVLAYIGFLKFALNGIDEWENLVSDPKKNKAKILKIRRKCFYIPYFIFCFEILIPLTLLSLLELFYWVFYTPPFIIFVKLFILLFSFITLSATVSFIISKKFYTAILLQTHLDNTLESKISLKNKILLQILPVFTIAILFTSLIGYSRLIDEKGNLLFKIYKNELANKFPESFVASNLQQVDEALHKIKFESPYDFSFIVMPGDNIVTSNNHKLSKKFVIYMKYLASKYNGKVYEETGETLGAIIKVNGIEGDWIVGIQYKVSSNKIVTYFIISFLALLALGAFVLYYFSKTISDDIKIISSSLFEIAEGEDIQLENKIPITSNDEIGDLVIAFNKVQEREKKHIQDIKEQQNIIMERERLVSLGQMMGGITHNLKFPIMSIGDYIQRIKDLANDLEESVTDDSIPKEEYLEIITNMKNDLHEMRPFCSYMSDILSIVEEQAVQLNSSIQQSFTIAELKERILLLMNHELTKYNCKLKLENKIDPFTIIKGEINNLVQVINNIVLNSIQAYEGQDGIIDLIIEKKENRIIFTIRDYAKGIPEEIQSKLFQEMVTTKGTKGSGLGLYMSRLTIKGRFGGELIFKSKEGEGSTFYIIIPYQEDFINNNKI